MSQDETNIILSLRQLRRLYQQLAALLSGADRYMGNHGWGPQGLNYVFANLSYTLSAPQKWMLQDLFRFYRSVDVKHILSFVSVILDDVDNPTNLTEPLVTAGWFDYGVGNDVSAMSVGFNYSLARWHLKVSGRTDDGKIVPFSKGDDPKTEFVRGSTFGLPLLSIGDTGSLEEKVMKPLVANLKTVG